MVGYDLEDKAYCMELTYNYGLEAYEPGTGLKEFGIYVQDINAAGKAAQDLGYKFEDGVVIGPDQYCFRLLGLPEGRTEKFSYVLCRAADMQKSVTFYKDFLGFSDAALPSVPNLPEKAAAVSYTSEGHPQNGEPVLLIFYEDGTKPTIKPWEGRHAFALNSEDIKELHKKFKTEHPDWIMHDAKGEPIALQEKLGTLFIFIAKDPDGYEMCFVSKETMLPAVVEAVTNYDPKLLDWEARDRRIAAIKAAGDEVNALITKIPVVVFSKEWCPFCAKAKDAFSSIGADIFVKELEDASKAPLVDSPAAFQDYLAAKTNVGRSVPKVFIGGSFIGGGDDVVALHKSGALLHKCVAVGAAQEIKVEPSETKTHFFINGHLVSQEEYNKKKGV